MRGPTTRIELLDGMKRGEADAWTEFARRYGDWIRAVVRRSGLQKADCDDLEQQVSSAFAKRLETWKYDENRGGLRSYLATIVRNAVRAHRRATPLEAHLPPEALDHNGANGTLENDLDALIEREWRHHVLRRAWPEVEAATNQADLDAVQLCLIEGRSAAETSRRLGMSLARVHKAKSRALCRLRSVVKRLVAEEP